MNGNKYLVTASPHIGTNLNTRKIMLYVIIALIPSALVGIISYGFYSFAIILLSVTTSVITETIFNLIYKKEDTVSDLSAIVTGMILGLNLPPTVPFYIPIVGGVFAIFVVKMLFGGLGKNFANPACSARVFLLLAFASHMTKYIAPKNYIMQSFFGLDGITSATPLAAIKDSIISGNLDVNVLDLFLGRIAGSIGEISAIAIIVGGVFLILTKVINWKIPLLFFVSVALSTLLFYKNGFDYILPMLLSGGIMFAGFFMITDYASSPVTPIGTLIYAVGCGFLTVIIRRFGSLPEGMSFAILIMNLVSPILDKYFVPKPFGYKKPKKVKEG